MKIVIIGKAPGWKKAPSEGETWGIHSLCLWRPVSMVWDMHRTDEIKTEEQADIIKYVNDNKVPYMTLKKHKDIPTSIEFPLNEMPLIYSECSVAYMVWYAVHKGATQIDMYGVCLGLEEEYRDQRPSVEYWVGYARGKGITVIIHGKSAICRGSQKLYGYNSG